MQQGGGRTNAELRAHARGAAVLEHGHDTVHHIPAAIQRKELFLRRCVLSSAADELALIADALARWREWCAQSSWRPCFGLVAC